MPSESSDTVKVLSLNREAILRGLRQAARELARADGNVRDVRRCLLRAQFRIANVYGVIFNMNGRKHIIFYQAFRNDDRVFIICSLPRHKSNKKVFSQCEFAPIR